MSKKIEVKLTGTKRLNVVHGEYQRAFVAEAEDQVFEATMDEYERHLKDIDYVELVTKPRSVNKNTKAEK